MKKYVQLCGAKNRSAIISTAIKKHLVIFSPVSLMDGIENEHLDFFIHPTIGIHKNSYGLPDNIYQITQNIKILFIIGEGERKLVSRKRKY